MERPGAGGQGGLPAEGVLIGDLKPSRGREGQPREGQVSSFLETLPSALTGTSLCMGLLPRPSHGLPRAAPSSRRTELSATLSRGLPDHTALSPPRNVQPSTAEEEENVGFQLEG